MDGPAGPVVAGDHLWCDRQLITQAQNSMASPCHCGRLPDYWERNSDKMEKAIEAVNRGACQYDGELKFTVDQSLLCTIGFQGKLQKMHPVDQNRT